MARYTTERVRFDDWTRGNFGAYGPYEGARRGFRYEAINMQVYENGSLGVRPGLRTIAWTGLFNDSYTAAYLRIHQIAWAGKPNNGTDFGHLIVEQIGNAASYVTGANSTFWYGDLSALTSAIQKPASFTNVAWHGITIINDDSVALGDYVLTPSTDAIVLGAVPGDTPVLYRERGFSGGGSAIGRINYSAALAWNDFTDSFFFEPRDESEFTIEGLVVVHNSLLAWFDDQTWFALTGPNPDTASVRQVASKARIPSNTPAILDYGLAVTPSGAFFMPTSVRAGLTMFDGTSFDDRSYDHLRFTKDQFPSGIINPQVDPNAQAQYYWSMGGAGYLSSQNGVVIGQPIPVSKVLEQQSGTDRLIFQTLERSQDAWTMMEYGAAGEDIGTAHVCVFDDDKLLYVMGNFDQGGGSLSVPVVYSRDFNLNRPAHDGDKWSKEEETYPYQGSPNNVQGAVDLVDIIPEMGDLCRVAAVHIDFTYWKHGTDTYATPNLVCDIRQKGISSSDESLSQQDYEIGQINTAALRAEFDPDQWDNISDITGLRRRVSFYSQDMPFAAASQVLLSAIQSIAIHAVVVDLEYDKADVQ